MINTKFKLIKPFVIEQFYENIDLDSNNVIVRPTYLSICKADLRYFLGQRDANVLDERLPLALIHEAVGEVECDKSGEFKPNQKVVLLPNIDGKPSEYQENYKFDSLFCSSKSDGFMQELVSLPKQQIVPYGDVDDSLACISEFISVGVHAIESFMKLQTTNKEKIIIFGDGALGFIVANLLKVYLPKSYICVVGIDKTKLELFSFVDEILTTNELIFSQKFDHVFECVGGQASAVAINNAIELINPQGVITLLGVSEEFVPINTRLVLEKGITLIGRSRSTREDFVKTINLLETNKTFSMRCDRLISSVIEVNSIIDIYSAFNQSKNQRFKTVLKWNI